nr:MAG TPA: hypothetical protein [Bacteriophage sp.]
MTIIISPSINFRYIIVIYLIYRLLSIIISM